MCGRCVFKLNCLGTYVPVCRAALLTVYMERQSVAYIQAQMQTERECERERQGGIDSDDLCRCHFLEGFVGSAAEVLARSGLN